MCLLLGRASAEHCVAPLYPEAVQSQTAQLASLLRVAVCKQPLDLLNSSGVKLANLEIEFSGLEVPLQGLQVLGSSVVVVVTLHERQEVVIVWEKFRRSAFRGSVNTINQLRD